MVFDVKLYDYGLCDCVNKIAENAFIVYDSTGGSCFTKALFGIFRIS